MIKAQLVISTLLLVLLLVACASKVPPAPALAPTTPGKVAPAPTAAPVPVVPARTAWEMEWDKTVEAAKKEGNLVHLAQVGPTVRQPLGEAFRSRFGIGVEWLTGNYSELAAKVMAERRAGIYSYDVGLIAHVTPYQVLKPAGALESLDKVLLLPELTEPQEIQKVWRFGLDWVDKDHTMLAFAPSVAPPIVINTQLVKSGEITSYSDLLNPKWKGKIVMLDPTLGTGLPGTWAQMLGTNIMGWDYLRQLVEQEPFVTRDGRLATDWVARGKYAVGIAVAREGVREFIDAGAPLQLSVPKEGAHTGAGPGVIIVLKPAPHPNIAKLYVNWLLSKEGQTVYCKAYRAPSSRMDVSTEGVDPLTIPDPKVRYARSYSEEALQQRDEALAMVKEIFAKLKK